LVGQAEPAISIYSEPGFAKELAHLAAVRRKEVKVGRCHQGVCGKETPAVPRVFTDQVLYPQQIIGHTVFRFVAVVVPRKFPILVVCWRCVTLQPAAAAATHTTTVDIVWRRTCPKTMASCKTLSTLSVNVSPPSCPSTIIIPGVRSRRSSTVILLPVPPQQRPNCNAAPGVSA
jgi:hypothetical protein